MRTLEHIKGVVKFQYYHDGKLYYTTELGLLFPVPIKDIGDATFLAEDRATMFVTHIRKHIDSITSGAV